MSGDERLIDAAQRERIERFVDDWLFEEDGVGASLAVFDGDGTRYASGFGARDREHNQPATADTLYSTGSVTKTVTAIAVLQQVDSGALALGDSIADYLPYFEDVPGDPITVEALLSHSSGLPGDNVAFRDTIADRDDLRLHIEGATDRRITESPPAMYSNTGFKVLAQLVVAIDGRSYIDYVEDEVLAPLGMDLSTLDQAALAERDEAMTGYVGEEGERRPAEQPLDQESQPGDGGLVTSVTDLTRLGRWLLADGELAETRLLEPGTARLMAERHASLAETVDGDTFGYGYGVMVDDFLDEMVRGHSGAEHHSQAYVGAFDAGGFGVAMAANAMIPVPAAAKGVLAILADEDPTHAVPYLALGEKLATVAGTYESYRAPHSATVEADGGYLASS